MSWETVTEKFRALTADRLDADRADAIIDAVGDMEAIRVEALMELLRG